MIEILLQIMENNRDDLVVFLAGYADKMDRFFHSNPGFRSRVAHHIDFPDYDDIDLLAIGENMLASLNDKLSPDAKLALGEYISRRRTQPLFANARSIRNALDRARLRQANRLFAEGDRELNSRRADDPRGRRHSPKQGVSANRDLRSISCHCDAALFGRSRHLMTSKRDSNSGAEFVECKT